MSRATAAVRPRSGVSRMILGAAVFLPLAGVCLALWLAFPDPCATAWYFRLHRDAHSLLRQAMYFASDWVNPLMYLAYAWMLVYALRRRSRSTVRFVLLFGVLQLAISSGLVNLLKTALGAPRPWIDGEWGGLLCQPFSLDAAYHTLPSGHTAEISGSCTALALWSDRLPVALALGLVVATVGFSRVYLGWHHPRDVFFGLLLGSWVGWAAWSFSCTSARCLRSSPHA